MNKVICKLKEYLLSHKWPRWPLSSCVCCNSINIDQALGFIFSFIKMIQWKSDISIYSLSFVVFAPLYSLFTWGAFVPNLGIYYGAMVPKVFAWPFSLHKWSRWVLPNSISNEYELLTAFVCVYLVLWMLRPFTYSQSFPSIVVKHPVTFQGTKTTVSTRS